jgi:arsenate reductase
MTYQILHNPRCSKSRQALAILESNGCEIDIVDYLKTAPDIDFISDVCKMLNCSAETLVRKKESLYKELSIAESQMSESDWVLLLNEHPKLIERPIVIKDGKARIGRPPEQILEIISK